MHINRKPGEQVEVDWAGNPATIIDPDTGEILKAIFAGVMTYSQYAYVEAFLDMKQKYSLENSFLLNYIFRASAFSLNCNHTFFSHIFQQLCCL